MTEDQFIRGAVTAASLPLLAWLLQKAKAKLSAARDKRGCSLAESLGRRLGKVWARTYRPTK